MDLSGLISLLSDHATQVAALLGLPALVGLAARHFTKKAIEKKFQAQLQEQKHQHAKELQQATQEHDLNLKHVEESMQRELEIVKHELAVAKDWTSNNVESHRSMLMEIARIRATSYPILVSILRRMKNIIVSLHAATCDPSNSGNQDSIDEILIQRESIPKAMFELAQLEKRFDQKLSDVRIFSNTSDFALQLSVQEILRDSCNWSPFQREQELIYEDFCASCRKSGGIYRLSKERVEISIRAYNEDVATLSEQIYRPILPETCDVEIFEARDNLPLLKNVFARYDLRQGRKESDPGLDDVLQHNPVNDMRE